MPIQNKDLGRYTRPGIFITETDASVVELPIQDELINLIPGFSKKGPVNSPVYITNKKDFIDIFGDIDVGLERKGSYFHRTCLKMIESGPIWALNLLSTNDTRDLLTKKSISLASAYDNSTTSTMPYSRAFNRQDFWERDEEAFLDYVNDPTIDTNRLFHITNMGNKTTTTFIYKSSITGFDVTLEDWYGGAAKVPVYLHGKNWASDYIVSVLILEGDWTNYNVLSNDSTWSQYFDTTGLLKTTIQDFVNETNVTVLDYYDASLIPYFKDITGRDMYIKSLINNDTDKTGLFCTYYEDYLLDSDYPTGKIDLIGDGLVGQETTTLNFLSYNENIIESLTYTQTPLDSYGNVFGNYSTVLSDSYSGQSARTSSKANWYIEGANIGTTGSTLIQIEAVQYSSGQSWLSMPQDVAYDYHTQLAINDIVYFNIAYGGLSANTAYYVQNVTDNSRWFTVSATAGGDSLTVTVGSPSNMFVQRSELNIAGLSSASFFNIDGSGYTFDTGTTEYTFEPLQFTTAGDSYDRYDVLYLSKGDLGTVNILKGTQGNNNDGAKPSFTLDYNDYIILGYVHLSITSGVTPLTAATNYQLNAEYTDVTLDTSGYVLLTGILATGLTYSNINYVKLSYDNTSGTTDLTDYVKLRYRAAYNEMESYLDDGKGVIIDKAGAKYYIENATFVDYSSTSNAYIQIPVGTNDPSEYYLSNRYEWLVYYLDNEFYIGSTDTDRLITSVLPVTSLVGQGQSNDAGVIGKYSDIYLNYYNGIINNYDFGYVNNVSGTTGTKIYLKMWIENTDILYVDFVSDTTTSASPQPIQSWISNYSSQFLVWSNSSNYKQTVEIESFDTTKLPNLVYEIKVDKNRYSELIKGNFIEAYYNTADYESGGALYGTDPKKLCRIVETTIDTVNTNWKVIKTDAPIKIINNASSGFDSDYQTMTYPSIDTYATTYKGIALTPFTIHADSIPDGTEARQDSILDVIEKTTNLAKGLVNKNKITWRYLVDPFGLGLAAQSKQQYADLCGMKLNCLGFVNAPSVKTLKASTNPYFINDDRTLNTEYLKKGGDETRNPSFLYSFATGVGRSTIGYFFPYVTDSATDDIPRSVPPAAFVATTYMQKHITSQSAIEPWTIAAGISDGRVENIINVEMDFTDDDLSNLAQMGLNPIVKKRNNGFCIDNESTAQVFPYSSLSLLHSREVLIELENSLYDMLLRYQWKFNTPEVRSEIKYKADKICKDFKERYGLYNYRNTIDETNNTNYIIDLSMGVLDTEIEIIKGMGIIVNNITILKKGDIESSGFRSS